MYKKADAHGPEPSENSTASGAGRFDQVVERTEGRAPVTPRVPYPIKRQVFATAQSIISDGGVGGGGPGLADRAAAFCSTAPSLNSANAIGDRGFAQTVLSTRR